MQIISSVDIIERNLCNCIKKYENISMSVAWASASSKAFKVLVSDENKKKIQSSTVGLHFYQTHPNFIKEFLDDENVKFYKQQEGIFHPKIYLFWNNKKDWTCLIGSANFTQSALTKNTEVMTMFDIKDKVEFQSVKNIVDEYYQKAEVFKKEDFQGYQNIWNQKNKQKQNLDDFAPNIIQKPLYKSQILSLSWDEYYSLLLEKDNLDERLKLLVKAREYFSQNTFEKMTEEQRKNIVGANEKRDGINDWRLFGRMPIPVFLGRLASNDSQLQYISDSLEVVSLNREVSLKNYNEFLYYFKAADKSFNKNIDNKYEKAGWGYGVSPITRLLSMKRPDEFFCLTGANESSLMKNFGIKKEIIKVKNYERYWNEIIEPVRQSPWYNSDKPIDSKELQAWNGRVALMDTLFYNES
jgi:HKD family nuclease